MSGKVENERGEEEEEREMVDHWSHEHPLALVEIDRLKYCDACGLRFKSGEKKGYGCSQKCGYSWLLHEDCAEAPMKIRHAMHPQHTLTQKRWDGVEAQCVICERDFWGEFWRDFWVIIYRCTSAKCTFQMHIRCAQGSDLMYPAAEEQQISSFIHHPSHPGHELMLLRRKCSFKCDACGTTSRGSSYTCTNDVCQYWIHERCASLPHTMEREDHNHSLSLSFHVPPQYLKYDYSCEVCRLRLLSKHWIYHCALCSYAVHLSCAFVKSLPITREKGIMEFPISDVAVGEDLIGAFLRRQGVEAYTQPPIPHHDVDYEFHHHKLRLVSSSSPFQEEKEEEDDDEENYSCRKSELICDGCITPIFLKQTTSSSSSNSSSKDNNYYYMRCSMRSCKYYLHLACFQLPRQLSSLPVVHVHDHSVVLQSGDKLKPWELSFCEVCWNLTNGLYYACEKCWSFKVDVKCASMPATIYHAAHPQHSLNLLYEQNPWTNCDAGCNTGYVHNSYCYVCRTCGFTVHLECAALPASTASRRWDKHHPLPLTHDATLNHPGDFYCNQCEKEMNPKSWMYHCRDCDLSFHPNCLETTSSQFRNIKFGQKYVIARAHCHTLTYQLLTTKRRCDVCGEDRHQDCGFYCALCIFFICYSCTEEMIGDGNIEAVD